MSDEAKKKVSKTINYYRVNFNEACPNTLEYYLRQAHDVLPYAEQRKFALADQELQSCHVKQPKGGGSYSHVTLVTPGEPATTVPDEENTTHVDLKDTPPPPKSNFMDGDMWFFVRGNHMLFCSTHLPLSKAKEYIRAVFEYTEQPECARNFKLEQVADVDKLRMIETGVSSISLGAGLYPATLQHRERQSVRWKILGGFIQDFPALFTQDPDLQEYAEAENLTAELVIKFDRRKGGDMGQRRMQRLAGMVVADEEKEGFKITTYNNETLTAEDVVLRKAVKVAKQGKTAYHEDIWDSMSSYFEELRSNGVLEQ